MTHVDAGTTTTAAVQRSHAVRLITLPSDPTDLTDVRSSVVAQGVLAHQGHITITQTIQTRMKVVKAMFYSLRAEGRGLDPHARGTQRLAGVPKLPSGLPSRAEAGGNAPLAFRLPRGSSPVCTLYGSFLCLQLVLFMVGPEGLEPSPLAGPGPKPGAYANFATNPCYLGGIDDSSPTLPASPSISSGSYGFANQTGVLIC